MGSGNTCRNSIDYVKRMIDTVISMDKKRHSITFKWQLEKADPPGQKKLDREVFKAAYQYAADKGYPTTSSVFDEESLEFLMGFQIPFIKIACQPKIYHLTLAIPRGIPILLSIDPRDKSSHRVWPPFTPLVCIPEYPAKLEDYPYGAQGYSDHTSGLALWNYYHPVIWEKHFVLERSSDNPDAGEFALTPDQLAEVIG